MLIVSRWWSDKSDSVGLLNPGKTVRDLSVGCTIKSCDLKLK